MEISDELEKNDLGNGIKLLNLSSSFFSKEFRRIVYFCGI